jgi:mono/diheme cytochrome c family protein
MMQRVLAGACSVFLLTASTMTADQTSRSTVPQVLTIESLTGKDTFLAYCAPCHGRDGAGDGPVAPALRTLPADLRVLSTRQGAFPREAIVAFVTGTGRPIVAHGTSEMPVWGLIFHGLDPSDSRVNVRLQNVVEYIESLQLQR